MNGEEKDEGIKKKKQEKMNLKTVEIKKKTFEEKLRIFKYDIRENVMTAKLEIILVK